jgi:hypothetical protein
MAALLWKTRQLATAAMMVIAIASLSACSDDDPAEPEDEPEIQTVTLTVGASTITIDKTTGAASGQLVVPAGTSTVTASWKRADGSAEPLVTSAEFELRIVPSNSANASWIPASAFGGSLTTTGLTSGQTTTAQVSLFHKEEQHDDFGPYTFTIRIQ